MRAPPAGGRKRRLRIDDEEDEEGGSGAEEGGDKSGSETDEPPPRPTSGVHKAAKRGPGRTAKGEGKAASKVRRLAFPGAQCASRRADLGLTPPAHRLARAGCVRWRRRRHARDYRAGSRAS